MATEIPVAILQEPRDADHASSILRTGPEADALHHRMERGARISRYVLSFLGIVTASAGLALWIASASSVGLALGTFGGVLIALGIVQHRLYQRDQAHWPDQAHLWDDGLELVLHNGEVRGATWSDPDFMLQLVARRAPLPAKREYLLVWLMDPKVPPVELSADGFDQLRRKAVELGLGMTQSQRGRRADGIQLVDIRQSPAALAAGLAKASETRGPG